MEDLGWDMDGGHPWAVSPSYVLFTRHHTHPPPPPYADLWPAGAVTFDPVQIPRGRNQIQMLPAANHVLWHWVACMRPFTTTNTAATAITQAKTKIKTNAGIDSNFDSHRRLGNADQANASHTAVSSGLFSRLSPRLALAAW